MQKKLQEEFECDRKLSTLFPRELANLRNQIIVSLNQCSIIGVVNLTEVDRLYCVTFDMFKN